MSKPRHRGNTENNERYVINFGKYNQCISSKYRCTFHGSVEKSEFEAYMLISNMEKNLKKLLYLDFAVLHSVVLPILQFYQ